jgi:hypothetical protein
VKCLRRKALWSALLAFVILATLPVVAQTASSSLRGTVLEEDGKPSVGAIVQARSIATGAVQVVTTDESGRYILQALPVGQWTVVARSTAGAVSESVQVELHLQGAPIQNLTVGGGLTERVAVTAAARIIDRKETGGKLRIDAEKVSVLPSAGRVFTDLALLDSSVRPAAEGAFLGEAGSVFVVNGASGRSNSFLVDGLDNNDLTSGTSLSSFFSQQVIQEFVLLTHRYSPEFGRATGGVLNIVTKQGGNESRHEGFYEGAIGSWSESGSFIESLPAGSPPLAGSSRTKTEQYTVGFNFGGAFKKDRAFYFGAYEHSKIDKLIGYTGIDRNGVPGGRFVAPGTGDNFFVRTDFNLGDNRRLMIRASYDDRETAGVNVGGLYTPEAGFEIDEKDVGLAVSLTAIASPSAVSETRFAFSQSTFNQFANSELSGVTRPGGIFGGNPLNTQLRDETKFQFVENITWTRGSHTLKFGMDITHSRIQLDARFNPNGGFLYGSDEPFEPGDCGNINISDVINADRPDGTGTYPFVPCPNGDPNADLDGDGILNEPAKITTYPVVFSYVFGQPSSRFDDTKYGFFAQDSWQVTPEVFFEYGVRYDYSTYRLPESAAVESALIPNGGAGTDGNNIAPRVGFTWTPDVTGGAVIRGGVGLFYDKLVLAFPAVSAVTSGTEIGLFFPRGFAIELTEQDIEERGIDAILPELFFLPELTLRFSTTTKLETPYAVQGNVGIDIPTGRHGAFRANLTRSQGYRQPLLKDLNPVIGLFLPGQGSCPDRLDPSLGEGIPCHGNDPSLGSIAALATEGRSWYSGLDVGWRYRGGSSWVDASYTLSRAEDTGFDPLKGGISLPQDSENFVVTERGRADGDRKHRVVVSGDTPIGAGFRLSGVMTWSSGLVFNVTSGTDINVDGILTDRPEGVARNAGEDTDLAAINTFRISDQNPNDLTRVPISGLEEPTFTQLDVRIHRQFAFRDGRATGEVYLQVFNLLDRENIGLIDGRIVSENFGNGITLAGPPRTVVAGFKVSY